MSATHTQGNPPAMTVIDRFLFSQKRRIEIAAFLFVLSAAFYYFRTNPLIFHGLAEFFSIMVAFGIFATAWNTRKMQENGFFLFMGIAFCFVGSMDLMHTLAYENMLLSHRDDVNLSTQLWITARYAEGLSLLTAPLFFNRQIPVKTTLTSFILVFICLYLSLFYLPIFPDSFIDGYGWTPFKIVSDYLFCVILAGAAAHLYRRRKDVSPYLLRLLMCVIALSFFSVFLFAVDISAYGFSYVLGHFCKLLAFYLIYKALIQKTLTNPTELLIHKMKESEEKYRTLYNSTPLPYQSLDEHGCLLDTNPAWLAGLGYAREDVIGRWFGDFLDTEGRAHFEQSFAMLKQRGYIHDMQFRMRHKGGAYREVSVEGRVGYTSEGEFKQTYCVFQDITQRKQADEALRQSESKFRLLAEHTQDWEYWLDVEGQYQYVSPACEQITGYSPDDFVNNPKLKHEIVREDHREQVQQHHNRYHLRHSEPHFMEFPIITRTGEERWLAHRCTPIFDSTGCIVGRRGSNRDITERIEIEAHLLQSQKMEAVGTLAGGIAHDFNNILSGIIGFSEIAKLKLPADSKALTDIDEAIKASKRAAELVKQILTFSRKDDCHEEIIQPHLIVKEATKMLRSSLPSTTNIVENIDTNCGLLNASVTRMHQIIMNLCTNASQSLPGAKGTIHVSLQCQDVAATEIVEPGVKSGPFIVISISDDGQGMDEKTLQRIFEPYFTTKGVERGTGLGLAVVHGIVHDLHGFIRVKSALGEGSTFQVFIPETKQQATTPLQEEGTKDLPLGTERILVVDDEINILSTMRQMLEQLGYRVTSVSTGEDALSLVTGDATLFDLVITDQTMPNITGTELAVELLKLRPDLPMILCTGYSPQVSEEDARQLGIRELCMKPLDLEHLARMTRRVLDASKEEGVSLIRS